MTVLGRVAIRIPHVMMDEVDRLVREHPELNYNRQQFVESAVREKIENTIMLENAKSSSALITVGNHPTALRYSFLNKASKAFRG